MSTTVFSAAAGLIVVALLAIALVLRARRLQKVALAITVAGVLLAAVGFVAILIGDNRQQDYNDQQAWPTVEAEVLKVEIQSAEEGECDIYFTYRYTINGTTYTNHDMTSSQPQACGPDRANTNGENPSVTVRYDPEGPQHSFIESAGTIPGSATINRGRIAMALGSLGLLGAGAWFWRKRNER